MSEMHSAVNSNNNVPAPHHSAGHGTNAHTAPRHLPCEYPCIGIVVENVSQSILCQHRETFFSLGVPGTTRNGR